MKEFFPILVLDYISKQTWKIHPCASKYRLTTCQWVTNLGVFRWVCVIGRREKKCYSKRISPCIIRLHHSHRSQLNMCKNTLFRHFFLKGCGRFLALKISIIHEVLLTSRKEAKICTYKNTLILNLKKILYDIYDFIFIIYFYLL